MHVGASQRLGSNDVKRQEPFGELTDTYLERRYKARCLKSAPADSLQWASQSKRHMHGTYGSRLRGFDAIRFIRTVVKMQSPGHRGAGRKGGMCGGIGTAGVTVALLPT